MVRLRALEPEDLQLLYGIENDPTLWCYGAATAPYSRYQLRQYIESASDDAFRDGQVRFAIDNAQGTTVGYADLLDINALHSRAEVAIVILIDFQKQGYATDALHALSRYARQRLQLHQLYAYVSADNEPSHQLFRRAGFQPTALLHDWLSTPTGWMDVALYSKLLAD